MTILATIFIMMLVVMIHELGHFAVAKFVGIKVNEFSIGMGPKIFNRQKGETLYSLRALPVGGYVSMEGEDEASMEEGSFNKVSAPAKLAVILAGPIMNFILAFLIMTIVSFGIGSPNTSVGELLKDSPAQIAGLEVGDRIISIDGKEINEWSQIVNEIGTSNIEEPINLEIIRSGSRLGFKIRPVKDKEQVIIGIVPARDKSFIKSFKNGFLSTKDFIASMFEFLSLAISGKIKSTDLSGPVGVVGQIDQATKLGFYNVLILSAFISVNLGFFNLLPIPALDGGRAIFIIIEILRGKPIDPDKEGLIHFVGFALLIILMLVVTYKDILVLIRGRFA